VSAWGKWLFPIVVPTGGWDFSVAKGEGETAGSWLGTIAAGTYATILELCDALEKSFDLSSPSTITVSSVGYVVIRIEAMNGTDWDNCDEDLLDILGYDQTEEIEDSGLATAHIDAAERHMLGWYPGVLSWGEARGDGVAADSGWRPVDQVGRAMSGARQARLLVPVERKWAREIRYGALTRSERLDDDRGAGLLEAYGAACSVRWYPDRDVGTVADPGELMDPLYGREVVEAEGYWCVTLLEPLEAEWHSQHPDRCTVSLVLAAEPEEA